MKSKTTALWFVLAATLAASIWLLNTYFQPGAPGERPIFPGLQPRDITSLQIIPAGAREISVVHTNKAWLLQRPVAYPAQTAAVEGLLDALQKLTPVMTFSAAEMSGKKDVGGEFGFDNPQFDIDVAAGEQTWHVRVGNKTAPGDGVYVQVVGAPGAYVTDIAWLQFLPHDGADWRDTTLVDIPAGLDWLVISNGTQAIELRRDLTNRLWRMVRPLQARADNLRIVSALQQLRTATVSRFVSDTPKTDLSSYGLDSSAMDLWLGVGTNLLTALHTGKEVTGAPGEIYTRREGWNTVVTTPKDALAPWHGEVNNFRDRNLLELTAPVVEIDVRGANSFTLQQHGSNAWTEAGEKFPVDMDQLVGFLRTLAGLQISDFAQDVVNASGLQGYGLTKPALQITLRSTAGDTNSSLVQVMFGGTTTNEIYVKRSDEDFVYTVALSSANQLPLSGDYFRDRRVWNFSETNVAQVTVRQGGKVRQYVRTGTNSWSLAAGTGIINPLAVEETVHQLGQLSVEGWIGRKFSDADAGLGTNSPSITVELKSGEKRTVDFGRTVLSQTAVAVVTLEGDRWAFVFPPVLYGLISESLTIPPDSP